MKPPTDLQDDERPRLKIRDETPWETTGRDCLSKPSTCWLRRQTIGSCNESIRYVVRAEQAPAEFGDEHEERMFQLPLNGNGYKQDNRAVYRLLNAF
jgi:hypothetical protein